MYVSLMLRLVELALFCHALKVFYLPKSGTPVSQVMMNSAAYNPTDKNIYVFGGRDSEVQPLYHFKAFNTLTARWRQIEKSTTTRPGKP